MPTETRRSEYRTINLKEDTFSRLMLLKLKMEMKEHRAISHDEFIGILLDKAASLSTVNLAVDFA